METDLINECVETVDLLDDDEQHIPEEKRQTMKKNIDNNYKNWLKAMGICHRNLWQA